MTDEDGNRERFTPETPGEWGWLDKVAVELYIARQIGYERPDSDENLARKCYEKAEAFVRERRRRYGQR